MGVELHPGCGRCLPTGDLYRMPADGIAAGVRRFWLKVSQDISFLYLGAECRSFCRSE